MSGLPARYVRQCGCRLDRDTSQEGSLHLVLRTVCEGHASATGGLVMDVANHLREHYPGVTVRNLLDPEAGQ